MLNSKHKNSWHKYYCRSVSNLIAQAANSLIMSQQSGKHAFNQQQINYVRKHYIFTLLSLSSITMIEILKTRYHKIGYV